MTKALAVAPNFPDAIFADGLILARLKQDDAAKARFDQFVKMRPADDPDRQRAMRAIATSFGVQAIPQTFTIDADGILQDQHIGDASIEGKLQKLIARVSQSQLADTPKP